MTPSSRTASLRLQLIDAVTGPAKGVSSSLKNVDGVLSKFAKNGSTEMRRLVRQLDFLKQKSGAVEKFSDSHRGLKQVTVALEQARSEVTRLEKAIAATTSPTKKMQQDLDRAKTAVRNATQAFQQQNTALREAEGSLRKYSIGSGRNIETTQQRIRSSIAQTIRSMRQLDRVQQEESRRPRPLAPPRNPRSPGQPRPPRDASSPSLAGVALEAGAFYGGTKLSEAAIGMVTGGAQIEAAKTRIRNVSNNEEEVQQAAQIAADASGKYPLTSQAESLKDYVELRSLAVSKDHGKPIDMERMRENVMLMAQARAALAASNYDLGDTDAKALSQAIEGTGRTMDPKAQRNMLDAFVRAKQVFGTAIDATSIRDFVMNAKAQNFAASDESFFYTTLARIAQGNPSRLGNEFSQTMNTLVGGHMTKQGAQWLAKMGMIDPSQIRNGQGGKFYIDGQIKNQDLLSSDQTSWAQQVLLPGLVNSGVLDKDAIAKRTETLKKQSPNADPHMLEERAIHGLIADSLSKSGFRTTVTDNLIHAIANEFQTTKDIEQMKTATGLGAADSVGKNPIAAFHELTTSIANFGAVLTNPAMGTAAETMHSIAGAISEMSQSLSDWQKDHPTASKAAAAAAPAAAGALGGYLTWKGISGLAGRIFGGGAGAAAEAAPGAAGAVGGLLGRVPAIGAAMLEAYLMQKLITKLSADAAKDARSPPAKMYDQGEDANRANEQRLFGGVPFEGGWHRVGRGAAPAPGQPSPYGEYVGMAQQAGSAVGSALSVTAKPTVDTSSIDQAINKASLLRSLLSSIGGAGRSYVTPPNANKFGGPRAKGGSVSANRTYLVGEKGPELFTPGSSGSITANHQIGGSLQMINHFHLSGKATAEDANEILRKLNSALSRSPSVAFGTMKPWGD